MPHWEAICLRLSWSENAQAFSSVQLTPQIMKWTPSLSSHMSAAWQLLYYGNKKRPFVGALASVRSVNVLRFART
jgi:hypothetical protein